MTDIHRCTPCGHEYPSLETLLAGTCCPKRIAFNAAPFGEDRPDTGRETARQRMERAMEEADLRAYRQELRDMGVRSW